VSRPESYDCPAPTRHDGDPHFGLAADFFCNLPAHFFQEDGNETLFGDRFMNTSAREKRRRRMHFLDNLRTLVVFLVVLCHAGGVYESSGLWACFWIVDDPAVNDLSGLVNIVLDLVMMPTLFFISGYLAPASLQRRSGWAFVRARCRRLLLPWLIGALTLLPLYKVIFLYSRHLSQEGWTTYFHWSNGIWGQNWLWFLPVLFAFDLLFLLFSKSRIRVPDISLKHAIAGTLLIGFVYGVGMDLLGLRGWTKTALLDFQNERLLIYFLVFLVGALCFKKRVFEAGPRGRVLYHVVNSVAWLPVTAYIFLLLYPWFHPGRFIVSPIADRLFLWFSYQLSLLCLMYVLIETFRRYQDKPGRLREGLNGNSYAVYVIHVVVMGPLALLLLNTALPSLWKYAILTVSTYAASHLIVSCCRAVVRYRTAWGLCTAECPRSGE
jgi:fucose 4-O-acetylase-like acetyltransferase